MTTSKTFLGEAAVLVSALLFAASAILVKFLSEGFDGYFISLFRFVVGAGLAALMIPATGSSFRIVGKRDVILRGLYGAVSMILYYVSIQYSGAGRATLFNSTFPIFVVIFGAIFFRERVDLRGWASIAICVLGVAIIFGTGGQSSLLGDAAGLASGFLGGFSVIYTKKARLSNNSFIIYGTLCVIGAALTAFSAPQAARLDWRSAALLVVAGCLVYFAQILFTYGIKFVPAAHASVISLLKVPLTIALGAFIGESLHLSFFIGTAIILAGLVLKDLGAKKGEAAADPA
jgi:drug/metabolite transporter (DMT)-like permease